MSTKEDHRNRHVVLHKMLDELVADWITETGLAPSKCTVMDLVVWSNDQTIEPSDKHNRFTTEVKNFAYFQSTDVGMYMHVIKNEADFAFLNGWQSDLCKHGDTEMVKWMDTAEIGEVYDHRLGALVRLKGD